MIVTLVPFIIYFLFNFFLITPYQYTYLNAFSGKAENRYQKFENDYWGSSINELIKNSKLDKNTNIKFSYCGLNQVNIKNKLRKNGYINFEFVYPEESDFIIMNNIFIINILIFF